MAVILPSTAGDAYRLQQQINALQATGKFPDLLLQYQTELINVLMGSGQLQPDIILGTLAYGTLGTPTGGLIMSASLSCFQSYIKIIAMKLRTLTETQNCTGSELHSEQIQMVDDLMALGILSPAVILADLALGQSTIVVAASLVAGHSGVDTGFSINPSVGKIGTLSPSMFAGYPVYSLYAAASVEFVVLIQGPVPRNFFESIAFVDDAGNAVTYSTSNATYSINNGVAQWAWPLVDVNTFTSGNTYALTFTFLPIY